MFFEFDPNEQTDGIYSEPSSGVQQNENSSSGRSSTLDAEVNINSLSKLDQKINEYAEQAIESIKGYPATANRLQAIVDDFRQRTTLRTLKQEQDFLDSQMNVQAQTDQRLVNLYRFPKPVIELGEEMMSVMKNLGFDNRTAYGFVQSLYMRLHEVYVQEMNLYSSGETLNTAANIIKDFLYKKSNKDSEILLSKISSRLQELGYKKPFKITKFK